MFSRKVLSLARPVVDASALRRPLVRAFATANKAPAGSGFTRSVVITAAGPDRSGVVADLSDALYHHSANIENSRMAVLGNDFAVILRSLVPGDVSTEDITTSLQETFPNFMINAHDVDSTIPKFMGPTSILEMHVEGPDQPGIVKNLTAILKEHDVSVRDLYTDTHSAPFAGYPIFSTKAILAVPQLADPEKLDEDLQKFEEDFGVALMVAPPGEKGEESEEESDYNNVDPVVPEPNPRN